MRTIIGGTHTILDYQITHDAIAASGWAHEISEVVSGGATGPDSHAVAWARLHHLPVRNFSTEWLVHGLDAEQVRIRQMAEYADALILIWNGRSRGASLMLALAQEHGLRIYEHRVAE